jgi:hypothetical protein
MRTAFVTAFLTLAALLVADDRNQDGVEPTGYFESRVLWHRSPEAAFEKARSENKPVFMIHLSGDFEDPRFT